jgi:hypothetical protein
VAVGWVVAVAGRVVAVAVGSSPPPQATLAAIALPNSNAESAFNLNRLINQLFLLKFKMPDRAHRNLALKPRRF